MWRLSSCSLTGLSRCLDRFADCTYQSGISRSTSCCAVCTYSAVWEGGAGLGRRHQAVVGGGGRNGDTTESQKTQANNGGGVSGEKEHGDSPFAVGRGIKDGVRRGDRGAEPVKTWPRMSISGGGCSSAPSPSPPFANPGFHEHGTHPVASNP